MSVVISLDAGTTGVRAMAVGADGTAHGVSYREFPQYFPRPGWVEHDADEIWAAVAATTAELLRTVTEPVAAIGITNQRETTLLWDRRTGAALHRALVWQDRRTADRCARLQAGGHLPEIRAKTGLVLDPYFSASKVQWLLEEGGVTAGPDLAFGTIDSWLIWKLSGGTVHATDVTNASRTLLYDITKGQWDPGLADLFGVPLSALPEVRPSSGQVARTASGIVDGLAAGVPVSGVAGDQQSALFGQACFTPGMTKNTYGTGSFVLMNVGTSCPEPVDGLLTTVAWAIGNRDPVYALEGSIFVTGAAVQWLRDEMGLIAQSAEIGPLASSVVDAGGAFFVPALTGLGSPWWDPHARGTLVGLTRGVGRAHLARAAVEAMAYQTKDVIEAMEAAGAPAVTELRVDGGAAVMDLLLQLQADLLGVPVVRAAVSETTALGVAFLAGLAEGVWSSEPEIAGIWTEDATARPEADRGSAYNEWKRAVDRSRKWEP
jgi:glycerol kinase